MLKWFASYKRFNYKMCHRCDHSCCFSNFKFYEKLHYLLDSCMFITLPAPKVENKELSLWDLGLLDMYGKNNNSNRKSIFRHIAGLAATLRSFQPSRQHTTVAAENLRFNTPLATANARWRLPSHTIVDCIADLSSVSTVCWHKHLLIEVMTVNVY